MDTNVLSIEQLYDLLTPENKEAVNRQIAILLAEQLCCR
jgi:hypothetical protein